MSFSKKDFPYIPDLDDEERILLRNVLDKYQRAQDIYKPLFTFFLDERKTMLCEKVLESEGARGCFMLFGGYEGAKRQIAALYPQYYEIEYGEFPVTPVTFTFRAVDKLSHRDILGSLMSLDIKRECVGDILVGEGRACVFVYNTVLDDVLMTSRIGRVGVKAQSGYDESIRAEERFKEIADTVSSLRIDAVVSAAAGVSREKAASAIRAGLVTVNHKTAGSVSDKIDTGVGFSVRGIGRFELCEASSTKKGRIHIKIKKYL